jgi:hypothetical protein
MPFSSKKNLTYLGGLCLLSNSINTITSRGVVQSLGTPLRSLMNIPGSATARASRRDRPPHRLPTTLPTQKAEHAAAALRPDYSPIIIRLRCPPLRLPLPSACYSKNSHQAGRAGQCPLTRRRRCRVDGAPVVSRRGTARRGGGPLHVALVARHLLLPSCRGLPRASAFCLRARSFPLSCVCTCARAMAVSVCEYIMYLDDRLLRRM